MTDFRAPRMRLAALAAALVVGMASAPSRADEAKLPPMPKPLEEMATTKATVSPEQASMEAWGRAHPDCLEWTDQCQVCVAGDKPGCSTVGTACVRKAATCSKTKTAAQPAPSPAATTNAPAPIPPPPIAPTPAPVRP